MTGPAAPIELAGPAERARDHFPTAAVPLPASFVEELSAICAVSTDLESRLDHSRDWWPLSLGWALAGEVPARPAAVARPADTAEVTAVLRACNDAAVPVTAAGGRSGVCGGSVPVFGGIVLDTTALGGIQAVDETSMLVDVAAGTFGPALEETLRRSHDLSVGHLPQSIDLSTVGGWIACRGAGQYSTRYGKIEDMVAGLEVVLADGVVVRTGALAGSGPRSATGPDLTQLFVGSEGTLGVVTAARLRAHPRPAGEERRAFGFGSFEDGLEALRRTLRRGATPAVLRLYDEVESERNFGVTGANLLVALDEGDPGVVAAAMSVLGEECAAGGAGMLDSALCATWLDERNDVSALRSLSRAGIVVDTVEVAGSWSSLRGLCSEALSDLRRVDGCLSASVHLSHAYPDGACLYFSFAGRAAREGKVGFPEGDAGFPEGDAGFPEGDAGFPEGDAGFPERFYRRSWDAVMSATLHHKGSISHHHGIGLVRGGYLPSALGEGFGVLEALKRSLDPRGILNPGKLGLASPFGATPFVMAPAGPAAP